MKRPIARVDLAEVLARLKTAGEPDPDDDTDDEDDDTDDDEDTGEEAAAAPYGPVEAQLTFAF